MGAYVATTASAGDAEYVKNLGADEVIDYKTQAFEKLIKDYDVVYDTVGGETFVRSHEVLKQGGILVTMAGKPDDELAKQYSIKVIGQVTKVINEKLAKLAELLDKGVVKVNIDKVFPLDQAGEAQAYLKAGQHRGKVVLKIK